MVFRLQQLILNTSQSLLNLRAAILRFVASYLHVHSLNFHPDLPILKAYYESRDTERLLG